jgi:hypothetical protein
MNPAIPKPDTIRLQARRGSGKLHVLPLPKPVRSAGTVMQLRNAPVNEDRRRRA